jgi:hypothetical protein
MRHGGAGASLVCMLLLSWTLGILKLLDASAAATVTYGATLLCGAWMFQQIARVSKLRSTLPGCQAWDERGRPIRIELL